MHTTRSSRALFRGGAYLLGLGILALGITMNTKAGLGVFPIISVSFSTSTLWGWDFGNTTLALYSAFVLVEMALHASLIRRGRAPGGRGTSLLVLDALQFPLSLVFTRFLNGFSAALPDLATDCAGTFWGTLPGQLLFLCLAILCTGVGAALSLNMRLIPNPGDGIVQALADFSGKSVGFSKNCFDLCNVALTAAIGLLAAGQLVGIGLGTVLSMIGVGRVIALFNHFCFQKTTALAGLQPS